MRPGGGGQESVRGRRGEAGLAAPRLLPNGDNGDGGKNGRNKVMDVICAGLMVVDAIGRTIDRFPEPGKLVLFDSMKLDNGGCAMNTAAALGKLGVSVGVVGRVGGRIPTCRECVPGVDFGRTAAGAGTTSAGVVRFSRSGSGFADRAEDR